MTEQVTDFTALHDAMAAELSARLPVLRTVDALGDEPPSDVALSPAVFVGVEEMTKSKKASGGRVAMTCQMVAYCVLSTKTPRADVEILNMAASVASVVDGNRWGLPESVEPPKALSAMPGTFAQGGHGCVCWVVSWEQTFHIGQAWSPPDVVNDAITGQGPAIDGIYVAGCHDELHRLGDFPNVDE
ncbi:MAG: hypothetical protein ACRDDI_13610 [Aeromonas veronii]